MPSTTLSAGAVAMLAAAPSAPISVVNVIDFIDIPLRLGDAPPTGGNSWEEGRIVSIDNISRELPHPGGGGVGSVLTARFRLLDIGDDKSPLFLRTSLGAFLGQRVRILRYYADDSFNDAYWLFGGRVEDVEFEGNIAVVQCSSQDKLGDVTMPQDIITRAQFADIPDSSVNRRIPFVYGDSADVGPIPAIRVGVVSNLSWVAHHPMKLMAVNWGVAPPGANVVRSLTSQASVQADVLFPSLFDRAIQLFTNLTNLRPGFVDAGQSVSTTVNTVFNFNKLIKPPLVGITGSVVFNVDAPHPNTGTGEEFDGWGFSSATVVTDLTFHEGNNQVQLSYINAGRPILSVDTRVFGQIILRSLDENSQILNEALFSIPNLRTQMTSAAIGETRKEVLAFPISPNTRLDMLIRAFFADDIGGVNDDWVLEDLQLSSFYLPENDEMVVFVNQWQGRADLDGVITGTPFDLITNPVHAAHHQIFDSGTLQIETASFATAAGLRTARTLAGGLGAHWSEEGLPLSQILDEFGLGFGVYYYPLPDDTIRAKVPDFSEAVAFSFDETSILGVEDRNGFRPAMRIIDGRREDLYSAVRILWNYSPVVGGYTEETFVTPGGCNHANASIAAQLASQASIIASLFSTQLPELIIEQRWIYNQADADLLLEQLAKEYVQSRRLIQLTSSLKADALQLGDIVDVDMVDLPDAKAYLVLARRDLPTRSRIQFTLIESTSLIVDYLRMWDGVTTRFIFFSSSSLVVSTAEPSGTDLTIVDLTPTVDPVRAIQFASGATAVDVAVPGLGVVGLFETGGADRWIELDGPLTGLVSTASDPGGNQIVGSPLFRQIDGLRFELFIDDMDVVQFREVT